MMNKILSVVIPTYNMEKLLDKCLTSLIVNDIELMNQLEVLVIIDGAKDRSSEIAHSYEKRYPQTFRVIDKDNGNYGSCVNRGLKEATGKYIKILDADDSFNTLSFERYLNVLKGLDVDLVINNYAIVNEKGQEVMRTNRSIKENVKFAQEEMLPYFSKSYLAMHEVAYRLQLLKDNNYIQTEGVSYTDQEWVLFPVAWSKSVVFIKENLYLYLIGREGQTVSANAAYKNIRHFEVRILNTVKLYNKYNRKEELSGKYLRKRILSEIERVYLRYIYMGRHSLNYNSLHNFDIDLKTLSFEFHEDLNSEKLLGCLPFYYIKEWRSQNYSKLMLYYPLIDILLFYKDLKFKIKTLFAQ